MLYVKDLRGMRAFYAETLGLKPIAATQTDTWVEFDTGCASFALHAVPVEIADQIEILSPPRQRNDNPLKLMFEVDDALSARERLEAFGVTILQRLWGTWDGIDPEGNIFQIGERPSAVIRVLAGEQSEQSTVIACNLNAIKASERPRYELLIARLRAAVRERTNQHDGYAYRLDGGAISLQEVAEWITMERLCCPFLTLQLSATGNQEDWILTLTGPAGVKSLLEAEF
jgi:catechol 2,3-dioxygenase-like lactoylglutathione lyase family enzyme